MTGKIKTLGLALFAFAAFGLAAVQAAQAGSADIGAQPSVLTGEQNGNHVLTLQATDFQLWSTVCPVARFEGTVQGQINVTEGTFTPTYSGNGTAQCKFATFFNAQVVMNGCKYTITGQSEGQTLAETAWVDVAGCTAGKHIEVRVAGGLCTITIDEQNTLSHIRLENVAGSNPAHIKAIVTVAGIETTQDGSGCPDGDNHHATNSVFQGTTTVKAFQDAGTDKVQKHEHQYTEHTCGQQVSLTAT